MSYDRQPDEIHFNWIHYFYKYKNISEYTKYTRVFDVIMNSMKMYFVWLDELEHLIRYWAQTKFLYENACSYFNIIEAHKVQNNYVHCRTCVAQHVTCSFCYYRTQTNSLCSHPRTLVGNTIFSPHYRIPVGCITCNGTKREQNTCTNYTVCKKVDCKYLVLLWSWWTGW